MIKPPRLIIKSESSIFRFQPPKRLKPNLLKKLIRCLLLTFENSVISFIRDDPKTRKL